MEVPEIDVDDLATRRDGGQVVIDVRTPEEYEEFHLPDVVLIPMGELVERIDELPTEGQLPIICHTGARSYQVAEYLRRQGFDAVNVVGGMVAWMDADFPVETGEAPA
jgi:rhodanese-related sulfurtransferase